MVVHGDGEDLLRLLVANHELVEKLLDRLRGGRRRQGRRTGRLLLVARHHLVRMPDAIDADVTVRPGDDRHLLGRPPAKGTDIFFLLQL